MRKWLCLGIVTVAASCVGGYWLCSKPTPVGPIAVRPMPKVGGERHDGDAETSDTIEPLVVEIGGGPVVFRPIPLANEDMMPRVLYTPGMVQPPRPDAEFVKTPRMPYADEDAPKAIDADFFGLFFEEILPLMHRCAPCYPRFDPNCRVPYCER